MILTAKHVVGARALLGITQAQLAEAADVTAITIKNLENNKHRPTAETLRKIREVLEARGIEFSNGEGVGVRLRNKPAQPQP